MLWILLKLQSASDVDLDVFYRNPLKYHYFIISWTNREKNWLPKMETTTIDQMHQGWCKGYDTALCAAVTIYWLWKCQENSELEAWKNLNSKYPCLTEMEFISFPIIMRIKPSEKYSRWRKGFKGIHLTVTQQTKELNLKGYAKWSSSESIKGKTWHLPYHGIKHASS